MTSGEDINRLEQQRREKLSHLRQLGIEPYGGKYEGIEPTEDIKRRYRDDDETQQANCAGRIVLLRDIGKLIFLTLRDSSGTIQIGLSKNLLARQWELATLLELGDIIGAKGKLGRTKTGEITIWVAENGLTFLSKCLCPPPEKYHGLSDIDQRYRQRYVDLWANPEMMERFRKRSAIIGSIREFLESKGFLEVETPMMQTIAGGAAAKPFVTHHNSLDLDLFLRISPELFLKRLLVGGMEKIYEINRNFRNEGLSRQHNPEFTMLEVYQAYADYNVMMDLTEEIIRHASYVSSTALSEGRLTTGASVGDGSKSKKHKMQSDVLGTKKPWRRISYKELLKEYSGCDLDDVKAIRAKARGIGLDEADMDDAVVVNEVFEATVEGNLIDPVFVIDYPAALCPLAKRKKNMPDLAERFELFIGKMEIANAYTELNDPAQQYENFLTQLRGQEESLTKMDMDYITALNYGMPPAGGLGIGIDRLVMILTGATSIRDVVLFPLLRPSKD